MSGWVDCEVRCESGCVGGWMGRLVLLCVSVVGGWVDWWESG